MASNIVPNTIRAERATVKFFDGLSVDGYRMPDGEFRVGLTGASEVLGYKKNWLGRVLSRNGNPVKALRSMGFTEQIQKLVIQSIRGGGSDAQTISLDDFNCCIIYAIQKGKVEAIALGRAFTKLSINDFFRDAFGEHTLSIDEKRKLFYKTYAAAITPEQWRLMDREDHYSLFS